MNEEFDTLREDVLSAYESLLGLVHDRIAAARRALLASSRDRLAEGHSYVVVCGEFSRGKSSLLNALVERPGLFPVDVSVTTCAVVTLQWGRRDSATVHFAPANPDDPRPVRAPEAVAVSRVADFVTERANPGNAKNVLKIDMQAPIAGLESGLVLVDTPGIGSINSGHSAATEAFLGRADAILFVASAVEPLSVHELDFLELALAHCGVVVTALTMTDRVVDAGPVIRAARARIAKEAGADPASLVIVPVSSHRKRDALEDHDPGLLAMSGFPELEAALWDGLAVTCGAEQVRAVLAAMYPALEDAAAPVENELAALRGDADKVAAQLGEERERARRLRADAHGWQRDLQLEIAQVARGARRQLQDDLEKIREEFSRALSKDDVLQSPDELVHRLSAGMIDAADRVSRQVEDGMGVLADKYAEITKLSISVSGVSVTELDPSFTIDIPKVTRKVQLYPRFREMWMGGNAGVAAGSLAGTLAGMALGTAVPVAGTLVGGAIGLIIGLLGARRQYEQNTKEQWRRTYIADLRSSVAPKLEACRRRMTSDLTEQIQDYGQALVRRLQDEVEARNDSLDQSVRNLDESRQGGHDQVQRQHQLAAQYKEFASMRSELDRLHGRLKRLAARQDANPDSSAPSAGR
jgi:gas vesicle protein